MTSDPAVVTQVAWTEKYMPVSQDALSTVDSEMHQEQGYLEMFHAALSNNDLQAKEQFQHQLNGTMLRWIRLHPMREIVCQREKEEDYVARAFACFWQIMAQRDAIKCNALATVLQYLQASVNGVMLDATRASMRLGVSLATLHDSGDEVWKNVQNLLSDKRQERIAYLLFHCGLKPKEIIQSYPEEFGDVLEIASIRLAIFNKEMGQNEL